MENSGNFAHLETMISRLSCKNMKKQESFRYHMVSGFLAMVEMLHALRSLWETLFPFALLWWNVMLCATCAKYYSWNRSRFHLQWSGHRFCEEVMKESDVEEIGENGALPFHQSEHVEMKVLAYYHSRSCTQASCGQEMELGSRLLQQSPHSIQDFNGDMFLHDAHVDSVMVCAEEPHGNQVEESKLEASIMSSAHVSKALDIILPSGTSKLSFLHFPDERRSQQSGLLKTAYWAACPFLLPQQVAPLAMYPSSGPEKFLEYLWMQSTLRINRDFIDVKAPVQLLHNIYMKFSTLEEHLQISTISFVSRILSMIHSKEHAYLARTIAKYLTSSGCSVDDNIMRLVFSSSLNDLALTRSILSSEPLERIMDHLGLDIGKHTSSLHFSDFELKSDDGHTLDNDEEDVSEDEGSVHRTLSRSYDGYSCMCVSGSQSNVDLNDNFNDENAVQSRQMDVNIVYPAYSQRTDREDNIIENGDEMGVSHESPIHLNDNYHDFYNRSADWDVKYGGSHWFQEVDSVYGGYYDTGDGALSDSSYFDGSFESDDAVCGDTNHDNDAGVHGNSSEVKQPRLSDTWWDEDVVLVGKQEREEDSMEQAWQVV